MLCFSETQTSVNTSCVSKIAAIRFQPNLRNSLMRVGLCKVADGCVRKNVGNRWRLDRAGELEPYDNCRMQHHCIRTIQ